MSCPSGNSIEARECAGSPAAVAQIVLGSTGRGRTCADSAAVTRTRGRPEFKKKRRLARHFSQLQERQNTVEWQGASQWVNRLLTLKTESRTEVPVSEKCPPS
ncbi:unnamed protein product [Pleuronectes platessa]|uniref:Uncharacterized protein n=1 Tax=Pleuronectes platessa TaxID=8262 RepID=A0A9N7YAX7_PLEPL|nr:unnamed protein product [Pleuronectes platessa]